MKNIIFFALIFIAFKLSAAQPNVSESDEVQAAIRPFVNKVGNGLIANYDEHGQEVPGSKSLMDCVLGIGFITGASPVTAGTKVDHVAKIQFLTEQAVKQFSVYPLGSLHSKEIIQGGVQFEVCFREGTIRGTRVSCDGTKARSQHTLQITENEVSISNRYLVRGNWRTTLSKCNY
jgi:hypothetical protein